MEYVDRGNEGKKGAFRVHPRLPVLQIWPDIETGRRLLMDMASVEGEIMQRIQLQERLRGCQGGDCQVTCQGRFAEVG